MSSDTLLVTGIHREELAFGDHVVERLDRTAIDLLRIPHGITQKRGQASGAFYSNAQHREIYLQLRQQVKGRYRLLIDLHCGVNEDGHCADVFCHDVEFLTCLKLQPQLGSADAPVRLVNIVADYDPNPARLGGVESTLAYTWIPQQVWGDEHCTYVGLEVYLPDAPEGSEQDWLFTRHLILALQACLSDSLPN